MIRCAASAGSRRQPEPVDRQRVEQRRTAQVDVERVGQPVRVVRTGQTGRGVTGRDQGRVQVALFGGGHPPAADGPFQLSPCAANRDPRPRPRPGWWPSPRGGQLVAGGLRDRVHGEQRAPGGQPVAVVEQDLLAAGGVVRDQKIDFGMVGMSRTLRDLPVSARGMRERRREAWASRGVVGGQISGYALAVAAPRRSPRPVSRGRSSGPARRACPRSPNPPPVGRRSAARRPRSLGRRDRARRAGGRRRPSSALAAAGVAEAALAGRPVAVAALALRPVARADGRRSAARPAAVAVSGARRWAGRRSGARPAAGRRSGARRCRSRSPKRRPRSPPERAVAVAAVLRRLLARTGTPLGSRAPVTSASSGVADADLGLGRRRRRPSPASPRWSGAARQHQRDHRARLAGPGGTAGPVQVVLGVLRRVDVHDQGDPVDVDAAGRHVGGDQHVDPALAELGQRPGAHPLGLAAVQPTGAYADRGELLDQPVHRRAGS